MASEQLSALDSVYFRIASASTDQELESVLARHLPAILMQLKSSDDGVRKKVMEMLVHVNKRIKSNHNVRLPMDSLLTQYQDPNATSFVLNFTIIYIRMGLERLAGADRGQLVAAILRSMVAKPQSHQDSLLALIVPVLCHVTPPSDDPAEKLAYLGLSDMPELCRSLLSYLLDLLLLPYGSHPSISANEQPKPVPPCLSEHSWKRVAGDVPMKAEDLEKLKVNVVQFLGRGLVPDMDIAVHLVVGLADTRHSVASEADSVLRKLSGVIQWDEPSLVNKLYSLFLGTVVPKGKEKDYPLKRDMWRTPASARFKLKFISLLMKSKEAALQFPACIQVACDLLFGDQAQSSLKLRRQGVAFIHHLIEYCPDHQKGPILAVLLQALTRLLQSRATSDEENNGDRASIAAITQMRSSAYSAISKLGLRAPELVNQDISLIQTFFEALSHEDREMQMSVKEALSLMAPAFKSMGAGNLALIEALLTTYMEKDESQVRLVCVQYAAEVFAADHVTSRFILLLGAGDTSNEVRLLALSKLYWLLNRSREAGHKDRDSPSPPLPHFLTILRHVLDQCSVRMEGQKKVMVGNSVLPFQPSICIEMINYLRMCLLFSAGVAQPLKDDLNYPQTGAHLVTKFLSTLEPEAKRLLIKFAHLVESVLSAAPGLDQVQGLLHLVGCAPDLLGDPANEGAKKMSLANTLLSHVKEEVREVAAQLFGLLAARLINFDKVIRDMQGGFAGKSAEHQHGIQLALGFSLGRRLMLNLSLPDSTATLIGGLLMKHLSPDVPTMLCGAACFAIGELGRCGPLPLPDHTLDDLIQRLQKLVRFQKLPMKVRERAALSLGLLCIGATDFSDRRRSILSFFLECSEMVAEVELHLTMGEAIIHAVLGKLSTDGRDYWLVSEEDYLVDGVSADDLLNWLLDELCVRFSGSLHPNIRQATCLWLLVLTKKTADRYAVVQSQLLRIQKVFMQMLADKNDLVQDAASKGLGLVYKSSSEAQRQELIQNLLGSLMNECATKSTQKVAHDTRVFQEGEMGKTPTGDNLSTYKELCSLASDLNQPDLVYQFMHLANYNAMWNTRRGAAFGFSSIMTCAGQQLEPFLPKIVPKLYRYQFDPSARIQQAMSAIWSSLVPEVNKTLDQFLGLIVLEIKSNLTSPQWRVRESCCMALQDLVRGRTLDTVLDSLSEIWANLFLVMDDNKESVRVAAGKAVSALSRCCIKMCDVTQYPKSGQAAVMAILPPLLDKGLASTVADIRIAAMDVVIKICKSGGDLMRGHVANMISALLAATGEMEGRELNYLSNRLANDPEVQERLDLARISAAKSSPSMECIQYLLQFVDGSVLADLVPRMLELIKHSGSGLSCKGATSHVISTMTYQCAADLQPYTAKILAALVIGLADRNSAIRKTFAATIGQVIRTAKDSSIEKLLLKLRTWYLEKDDQGLRNAVALTFQAISRYNSDKLQAHAALALPLAFFAMHEEKPSEPNQELGLWEEVWLDSTPGSAAGTKLYLNEILSLLQSSMDGSQWRLRIQSAAAMATVAKNLKEDLDLTGARLIMASLLKGLSGRTWPGKETLLLALSQVVTSCSGPVKLMLHQSTENSNPEGITEQELLKQLFRECGKERLDYSLAALRATAVIVGQIESDHCFPQLYDLLMAKMNCESEEDSSQQGNSEQAIQILQTVVESLTSAYPKNGELQQLFLLKIVTFLADQVDKTTRKNQLAIATCFTHILTNWPPACPGDEEVLLQQMAVLVNHLLGIPQHAAIRSQSVAALSTLVPQLPSFAAKHQQDFSEAVYKAVDDVVKDLGSEANVRHKAREVKATLSQILQSSQECEQA